MSIASTPDAAPALKSWSTQEYHDVGEVGVFDGQRVELINGQIYVNPDATVKFWTTQQYHAAATAGVFDGQRVELIDGKIYVMSPMNYLDAAGIQRVQNELIRIAAATYLIRVQLPLSLRDGVEPEPDVALVAGSLSDFDDHSPEFAQLVVEVSVSSLDFDRTEKKKLYASHQIPEYWILNLQDRRLEVMRSPNGTDYDVVLERSADDMITSVAVPDHEIAVNDLLPGKSK